MSTNATPARSQDGRLPEGWYPDQAQPGLERRWDGTSWTVETRPITSTLGADLAPETDGHTSSTTPAIPRLVGWVRSHRILAVTAGAVLAVLLIAAVALPNLLGGRQQVQGLLILSGDPGDVTGEWDACEGTGGYDDITAGARASVRDGDGALVGTLEVQNVTEDDIRSFIEADQRFSLGWDGDFDTTLGLVVGGAELGYSCWLYIEGEVNPSEFYSVSVADRGELSFSKEELAERGWWFTLSLGS